jgi:sugar phosphate isomerase/epimerase
MKPLPAFRPGSSWTRIAVLFFLLGWARAVAETSAADRLGWKLAMHSYTLKKFPIEEAIDKSAGLGLRYMSLSGSVSWDGKARTNTTTMSDADWERIRGRLAAKGIVGLVNIGVVSLTTNEASDRKIFEFARKAGVDTLVAEPPSEALDLVERLCKEYQIKVAIHNHPKPSHYWNPQTVLDAVKDRGPWMGSCADVGHWMRSGLDPLACLKLLEGRVICLHFKDLTERDPEAHDVPWGTGKSNVRGLMEELKRQHFHGAFCIEYEYHWETSLPEIAECIQFFNKTCVELAADLPAVK